MLLNLTTQGIIMVTSISVAKQDEDTIEYLKEWCKKRGMSKSFKVMELITAWSEVEMKKDALCTTSTQ